MNVQENGIFPLEIFNNTFINCRLTKFLTHVLKSINQLK
jgi:hypothetical protein